MKPWLGDAARRIAVGLISRWKRNRAINSYVLGLSQRLARNFGSADWYSPEQIRAVVDEWEMDKGHLHYALALFTPESVFRTVPECALWTGRYTELRQDVARHFWWRNIDLDTFNARDVLAHSDKIGNRPF